MAQIYIDAVGDRGTAPPDASDAFPEYVSPAPVKEATDAFPEYTPAPKKEPAPETSAPQRLLIDYANQQLAASQRTSPLMGRQQPFLLGPATEDEQGNIGYKDAQGQFVPTDRNRHNILLDPADNTYKVYARSAATGEGGAVSAGHMLGTMFGPGNIMTSAVDPAVAAAGRLGVEVPRAILTESPTLRQIGSYSAGLPGGGPLREAIPQSIEQLGETAQDVVGRAGGVVSRSGAGEGFSQAVQGPFQTQTKSLVQQAEDRVGQLLNRNRLNPLDETRNAIADILTQRTGAALDPGSAVSQVREAVMRPGGLTYDGLRRLRSHIGNLLDSGPLPEGYDAGELRNLYRALTVDVQNAVINSGGPRAATAFQRAQALERGIADWREGLRRIIPQSRSGEGVYDAIIRMAQGGDERGLAAARAAVPADVWADIASTAISRLGINRAGEWVPTQFISDYAQLTPVGKRILFGSVGRGDVLPFLDDIAQVSNRFKEAGKLANVSRTAGHNAFWTIVTTTAGGIAGAAAGHPSALLAPVAAIGGLIGNAGLAKILASPATAASLARWSRAYERIAAAPTPAGMAALTRLSGELATNINGALGTRLQAPAILRSTTGPGTSEAGGNQQQIPRPPSQ